MIIDATNMILGRLASHAAKQSLLGKTISIINCNNALVTGQKKFILGKYKERRARGGSTMKGPHFPRSPERIVKRTIRGMLSYKQARGADALKRIKCYNETPAEFADKETIKSDKTSKAKTLTLKKLSELM